MKASSQGVRYLDTLLSSSGIGTPHHRCGVSAGGALVFSFLTLIAIASVAKAAQPSAACATRVNDFRPSALERAVVLGKDGERITLRKKHPTECDATSTAVCQGNAYLIPGNEVEVASVCGNYAYVRYTGESRTSTGWVDVTKLRMGGNPASGAVAGDFLARIEGYYAQKSSHCSEFDGKVLKPCDPPAMDCLLIRRIDDRHVELGVSSFQTNGNTCGTHGMAELSEDKLIYRNTEQAGASSTATELWVVVADGRLKFEYHPGPRGGVAPPFCGMQGRMDRVEFRLVDRQPTDDKSCGED